MDNPKLKQSFSLRQIQEYVQKMNEIRGFTNLSKQQEALLLGEEVGELFKSIRKVEGHGVEEGAEVSSVSDEMADVLYMLSTLANMYGIDLTEALMQKEEKNKKRVWEAKNNK